MQRSETVGSLLQERIGSMVRQARWPRRRKKTHYSPPRHLHAPENLQSVELSEVVRFLDPLILDRGAGQEYLCVVLGVLSKES